jgi:hypothetical protein
MPNKTHPFSPLIRVILAMVIVALAGCLASPIPPRPSQPVAGSDSSICVLEPFLVHGVADGTRIRLLGGGLGTGSATSFRFLRPANLLSFNFTATWDNGVANVARYRMEFVMYEHSSLAKQPWVEGLSPLQGTLIVNQSTQLEDKPWIAWDPPDQPLLPVWAGQTLPPKQPFNLTIEETVTC